MIRKILKLAQETPIEDIFACMTPRITSKEPLPRVSCMIGGDETTEQTPFQIECIAPRLACMMGDKERVITERVITITSDYTAKSNDCILANANGGPIAITLPLAKADLHVDVKKIDVSPNTVTVTGISGATIDGGASLSIATQWYSYTLISDGSNWYIISQKRPMTYTPAANYIGTVTDIIDNVAAVTLESGEIVQARLII